LLRTTVPPIKFDVPTPAEVAAIYETKLAEPGRAFELPARLPPVTVSHAIRSPHGRTYWIRFPSPSKRIGGMTWARVSEPFESVSAPSLVFGSGVCVDVDQWRVSPEPILALVRAGIRVIVLEAPWHGRRVK